MDTVLTNENSVNPANTSSPEEEVVFKIKYKSIKLMAYGLIFFSVMKDSKNCGFKQAFVSLKPNFLQDLNIEQHWELIKEKLFDMTIKKSDLFNQPMTEDVNAAISAALADSEFREDLIYNALQEKFGVLIELIKTKLTDVIPGRIELQCEIEVIDKSKVKEIKKETKYPKTETPVVKGFDFPKFILLSPIEDRMLGKKLGALKPNDKAILKIDDDKIPESALAKIPNYKFGYGYAPLVEFYKENSLQYAVFNLGSELFGRIPVTENNSTLRIKIVLDKNESKLDSLKFITDNSLTFYMIIILSAIIICFLSWIYYSWMLG